jgi:hypothetical protein
VSTPAASPLVAPGEAAGSRSAALPAVHDPGQVTGTLTGPCHTTGPVPDQLPDPQCTPGGTDPAVTQANIHQTICVKGYTATVRPPENETERFKFDEAYPAYGIAHSVKTELDHLVALELGGDNSAQNLWPEQPPTPNPKDAVEDAARNAVCSGQIPLAVAQQAIASNWVAFGRQLGVK